MADVLKPARRPKRARATNREPEQEAFCPIAIGSVEHVAVDLIELFPGNPRIHSERQIRVLAHIMSTTRVFVPIILDAKNRVLAGEGRLAAGRLLKMDTIPAIRAEGLSEAEMQTFRIADNRAVELGAWDERLLAISFRQLIDLKPNFSIEATGFLSGEIDIKLDSLRFGSTDSGEDPDVADRIPGISSATVSRPGDIWNCALHRVMCESCLNEDAMRILMKQNKAHMVLQDGPYNVSIARHASGLGTVKHKEFKMASGEMSREQFSTFLGEQLRINTSQCLNGAVVMSFMDWRSIDLLIKAGRDNGLELINMCVWVKSNGSMGSLYRSQHELICVFRLPGAPSTNNVQLGKFGRHRTNVWTAPGSNSFSKDRMKDLEAHPTPKNVALLADAIRDVSNPGEIVLDSFLGSGTTMIAAERTERVCYGMELDPAFVDVAVRRWEQYSGSEARLEATGQTFAQAAVERAGSLG